MPVRRVAIYVGSQDRFDVPTVLGLLCERWRTAGVDVQVLNDPAHRVDADVAFMHVVATRRLPAYDAVLSHYPWVINGQVRDISKRRVSANLVRRDSPWDGPVIVKTDLNCFGQSERARSPGGDGAVRRLASRVADRLAGTPRRIRRSGSYPVYDHIRDVPLAVWWDPRLVVERFLPERRDGMYCLRTWIFLGDEESATLSYSPVPVVKRANVTRHEPGEVPDALRAERRRLGFDYGKFDFVMHGNEPVLLDANSTPSCAPQPGPRLLATADRLAAWLLAAGDAMRPTPHSA